MDLVGSLGTGGKQSTWLPPEGKSTEELPKAVALQNQRPKGAGFINDINLNGFGELIWKGFPLEFLHEEPRRAAEGSSLAEPARRKRRKNVTARLPKAVALQNQRPKGAGSTPSGGPYGIHKGFGCVSWLRERQ